MSQPDFEKIVKQINRDFPLHRLWDGLWIYAYKRGSLILTASFDRIYYREFDLVFKQVNFFNIPAEWRDHEMAGDDVLRLSNATEFGLQHPDFDPAGRQVFAFDIHPLNNPERPVTFFILANHVYLNVCSPDDQNPGTYYQDPYEREPYPCMKNRAGLRA